MKTLHTTKEVIAALGGNLAVAALTGRTNKASWNWGRFTTFPANTYLVMNAELARRGFDASPALWRMLGHGARHIATSARCK
jgi:hypothetical protein